MSAELENPLHVRVNLCRLFYQGRDFFLQQLCYQRRGSESETGENPGGRTRGRPEKGGLRGRSEKRRRVNQLMQDQQVSMHTAV